MLNFDLITFRILYYTLETVRKLNENKAFLWSPFSHEHIEMAEFSSTHNLMITVRGLEIVVWRWFLKKVFSKSFQNSRENICVVVSF